MTLFENNDDYFNYLLQNADFSNIVNDVSFSSDLQLEDNSTYQTTLLLDPNAPDSVFDPTTNDNILSILDDIHFSNDLQLEDNFQNQSTPPAVLNVTDEEYGLTTNGDLSLELIRFMPDVQQDQTAILDEEALFGSSNVNENANITILPVPQQANGNQDGIMYQVNPTLFNITGEMSVVQQPKANNRSRYQCDGARFLPNSRYHPMSIKIPNLQSVLLTPNQKLGIVMTMVTDTNNPYNQTFVHANDIIYRVDNAIKIGYACVFVPFEELDIRTCEKKFPRLSVIYKKYDEYTFDLIPFDQYTMFGTAEKYLGKNTKHVGTAAKGKDFKKDYNLLSYKIVFQLALKVDNVVYISNITCETDIVDEQKITIQSTKRKASISTENYSEEEDNNSHVTMSRRSKKSKSSINELPVTRVSNNDIYFNANLTAGPLPHGSPCTFSSL